MQVRSEVDLPRPTHQCLGSHQGNPPAGQLPLICPGVEFADTPQRPHPGRRRRNSRRSLVRAAGCAVETPALATSCKIERWVRAVRSRPRSRNRKWSALASRAALSGPTGRGSFFRRLRPVGRGGIGVRRSGVTISHPESTPTGQRGRKVDPRALGELVERVPVDRDEVVVVPGFGLFTPRLGKSKRTR